MKPLHFAVGMLIAVCLAGGASAEVKFGADRHAAVGIGCVMCHGKGNPAEMDPPDINKCTQCHPTNALVEKTKDVKPHNPHVSPHYQDQLECTNCHHMHEKSEDFCSQCHTFNFKVP